MKLFVWDDYNSNRVYIDVIANSRKQLANRIGGYYFNVGSTRYSVLNVYAEAETSDTAGGAAIGGVVGLLGGPVGVLFGGILGGLIGKTRDNDEIIKARKFNNSSI